MRYNSLQIIMLHAIHLGHHLAWGRVDSKLGDGVQQGLSLDLGDAKVPIVKYLFHIYLLVYKPW
jgi:hypothetical protein